MAEWTWRCAHNESSNVSVLLGNGDGTFGQTIHYDGSYDSNVILSEDVNDDGYPDILVSNGAPSTVSVLLNTGRSPGMRRGR